MHGDIWMKIAHKQQRLNVQLLTRYRLAAERLDLFISALLSSQCC